MADESSPATDEVLQVAARLLGGDWTLGEAVDQAINAVELLASVASHQRSCKHAYMYAKAAGE